MASHAVRRGLLVALLLALSSVSVNLGAEGPSTEASEAEPETLINQDILDLYELGFSDEVVLEKIQATPSAFEVTVEALAGLKEAGVSEAVIAAMIAAEAREAPATPEEVPEPAPSAAEDPRPMSSKQESAKKSKKKEKKERVQYPIRTVVSMTCSLPSLAPLVETAQFQEYGGIQISVAPLDHRCVEGFRVSVVPAVPTFKERMLGSLQFSGQAKPTRFVEETRTPYLKVTPETLRFTLKISNKLSRVFRGAGIVVQYVVAGKLVAAEQSWYGDLVNSIVPPRMEQEVEIVGPRIATLPEQATFGLFLYDVVTATDEAGNITERHNFEWYFNYFRQSEEREGVQEFSRGWWLE